MPLDAKALGAMQPGLGGLLGLVGDVVPFRQTGPRPMNLEGGMARPGGGAGEVLPFGPKGANVRQLGPSTPAADKAYAEFMKFLSTDAGKYWWAMMGQAK